MSVNASPRPLAAWDAGTRVRVAYTKSGHDATPELDVTPVRTPERVRYRVGRGHVIYLVISATIRSYDTSVLGVGSPIRPRQKSDECKVKLCTFRRSS